MALLQERLDTVEIGSVVLLYRPRPALGLSFDELDGVQRLLILLKPSAGQFERLIAAGRTPQARSGAAMTLWGFVDLVLQPSDMKAALGDQVYGTRAAGIRQLPAARVVGRGTYSIESDGTDAHFRWSLQQITGNDPVVRDLRLEDEADFRVMVANPDPAIWNLAEPVDIQSQLFEEAEVHVTVPAPLPVRLQRRFGSLRFVSLDSAEWLEHPGTELVFTNTREDHEAILVRRKLTSLPSRQA